MPHDDLHARLELAVAAAREAGRATLQYFLRPDLAVELKADQSPVTAGDRASESLLRERIQAAFPRDAIVGEEFGVRDGDSGYRWALDPIDGTKSYISGVPLYSTLVGIERDGQALAGVIYIPALDELVYAATGSGAWYVRGTAAPVRARVSAKDRLDAGLFLTSEVKTFHKVERADAFLRLQDVARLTRTWGDGYGYLLVATGRAELMVDPKVSIWDCAALLPVIEEAGGRFSDWAGVATIHSGNCLASNGRVHDEALRLLAG
jgi:histidinol phosphatase-like enzyme (inositol monophosphatase family)